MNGAEAGAPACPWRVRPATDADLEAILAIYNDAVLKTTATYDEEPRTLEHRRRWFEEHAAGGFAVVVAVDASDTVVGWGALNRYHDRAGYRFTTENSVYVAEDQRGRGVGRVILGALVEAAMARGFRAILAGIDAENGASIRLHAGFGFEKVAHFRQVGFKFGRWLDVIYMEKLLG